jgi:hypothetical protein
MSDAPQKVSFDLKQYGIVGSQAKPVIRSPLSADVEIELRQMMLEPYGVLIAAIR